MNCSFISVLISATKNFPFHFTETDLTNMNDRKLFERYHCQTITNFPFLLFVNSYTEGKFIYSLKFLQHFSDNCFSKTKYSSYKWQYVKMLIIDSTCILLAYDIHFISTERFPEGP